MSDGTGHLIQRLVAVGRPDLAERLKHLAGKHNQARHGWRFAKGGDDAARLGAARRSMRGRDAGERAEYRKRAGMTDIRGEARRRKMANNVIAEAMKQPAVVRKAMLGDGISLLRFDLTDRERRQITAAARKGILIKDPNDMFGRRYVVSPSVVLRGIADNS